MPKVAAYVDTPEPIGIVISGPPRTDVVPRVWAYVWGPAPEPVENEIAEPRAA